MGQSFQNSDEITHYPKVSIIVPYWQTKRYVNECIESIFDLSYPSIEVIILVCEEDSDDTSIIYKYADIGGIIILSDRYNNVGEARNVGIAAATGEYILFVDSDDYLEDQFALDDLVYKAESTHSDIVCYPCRRFDDYVNDYRIGDYFLNKQLIPDTDCFSLYDIPDSILQISSHYSISRLYKRKFLIDHQLCFSSFTDYCDVDFSAKCMLSASRISVVEKALYSHRYRAGGYRMERFKHSGCLLAALERVYSTINSFNRERDQLAISFFNYASSLINEALRTCRDPIYRNSFWDQLLSSRYSYYQEYYCNVENRINASSKSAFDTLHGAFIWRIEEANYRYPLVNNGVCDSAIDSQITDSVVVSVIIPVYQSEKWLSDCLDSILTQTLSKIEVICVDDGSTDSSLAILHEYASKDDRVKIITSNHAGVSIARNLGIAQACGKYVYFMDSDDILAEDALDQLTSIADRDRLDVLYFNGSHFYEDNCSPQELKFRPNYSRTGKYPSVLTGRELLCAFSEKEEYIVVVWLAFFKRSILNSDNGIQFYPGMVHSDNLFTFQAIMKAERAGYCNKSLYQRRIHPNSIMTSTLSFRSPCGYYTMACQIWDTIEETANNLDTRTKYYCYSKVINLFKAARREYAQLNILEKGKALALNDYGNFCNYVVDYSNLSMSVLTKDKRIEELSRQLKQANMTIQSLQSEVAENAICIKNLRTEAKAQNKELLDALQMLEEREGELYKIKHSKLYQVLNRIRKIKHLVIK